MARSYYSCLGPTVAGGKITHRQGTSTAIPVISRHIHAARQTSGLVSGVLAEAVEPQYACIAIKVCSAKSSECIGAVASPQLGPDPSAESTSATRSSFTCAHSYRFEESRTPSDTKVTSSVSSMLGRLSWLRLPETASLRELQKTPHKLVLAAASACFSLLFR